LITGIRSLRQTYPVLDIPAPFAKERPSIIFSPISLSIYRPGNVHTDIGQYIDPEEERKSYEKLYPRLISSDLHDKKVTNLNDLRNAWSIALSVVEPTSGVHPEHARFVVSHVTGQYLQNLELYRLTEDRDGTAIRYTRYTDKKELKVEPSGRMEYGPHVWMLPDHIRDLARWRNVTYWFRSDEMGKHLRSRRVTTTTIRDLERDHILGLDTAEMCALVALTK
jgi:hypothetical protein